MSFWRILKGIYNVDVLELPVKSGKKYGRFEKDREVANTNMQLGSVSLWLSEKNKDNENIRGKKSYWEIGK